MRGFQVQVAFTIVMIAWAPRVLAEQFELILIQGFGEPVCEKYLQARNAVDAKEEEKCRIGQRLQGRDGIQRPMLPVTYLNLTVAPKFKGSPVDQVQLATRSSSLLHEQLIRFSEKYDTTLSDGALDDLVMNSLAVYTLPILAVDVDNDGAADPIFFYLREPPSWTPSVNGTEFGAPIVLRGDLRRVDQGRTLSILRQPIGRAMGRGVSASSDLALLALGDFMRNSRFGFFHFNGKTYFDVVIDGESLGQGSNAQDARDIQRVFVGDRQGARLVCQLRCQRY